jgi:glycine cleavage system H protein
MKGLRMSVPKDLKYTKDHEWARIEGNMATIGITDHAQSELGDIIFVEFPEVGQELVREEPFGTIEAVKTVADLYAPLSGKVVELNQNLEENPAAINEDPYNAGWIIKMEFSGSADLDSLLDAQAYEDLIA